MRFERCSRMHVRSVWQPVMEMTQTYVIQMATGDNKYSEASLDTADYKARAPGLMAPRLQVVKGADNSKNGCALIERPTVDWSFANSYRVSIAPGIDPILMLGLTICKDKIEEKKD